jgi:hypothetical protein
MTPRKERSGWRRAEVGGMGVSGHRPSETGSYTVWCLKVMRHLSSDRASSSLDIIPVVDDDIFFFLFDICRMSWSMALFRVRCLLTILYAVLMPTLGIFGI